MYKSEYIISYPVTLKAFRKIDVKIEPCKQNSFRQYQVYVSKQKKTQY